MTIFKNLSKHEIINKLNQTIRNKRDSEGNRRKYYPCIERDLTEIEWGVLIKLFLGRSCNLNLDGEELESVVDAFLNGRGHSIIVSFGNGEVEVNLDEYVFSIAESMYVVRECDDEKNKTRIMIESNETRFELFIENKAA